MLRFKGVLSDWFTTEQLFKSFCQFRLYLTGNLFSVPHLWASHVLRICWWNNQIFFKFELSTNLIICSLYFTLYADLLHYESDSILLRPDRMWSLKPLVSHRQVLLLVPQTTVCENATRTWTCGTTPPVTGFLTSGIMSSESYPLPPLWEQHGADDYSDLLAWFVSMPFKARERLRIESHGVFKPSWIII